MERELVELFEAAKKAADAAAIDGVSSSGPEVSRCIDALKQLKTFPITYDILVSTQVGKRLRPLTKHPKEKIQSSASNLLDIWKKIVIEETTKSKKNGSTDSAKVEKVQKASSVKIEKVSTAETVKVEKTGSVSRSETVKVERREANGEPVKVQKIVKEETSVRKPSFAPIATPKLTSLVKCNDALRDKIRELLVEALSKVAGEAEEEMIPVVNDCDPIRVAVSVESAMFEKLGRSNGAQKLKYRSIMFNIKDPKNPDLRRRVLLGEVKPERLITMTPEEMASDERQRQISQIKEKALFECERGQAPKATTDQFKCGRCGQRKCFDLPEFPDFLNQTVLNNNYLADNVSKQQHQLTVVTAMEEDSGIRLVHMLMTCAESIQRGEMSLAASLIEDMKGLLTRVNNDFGIGKVAGYFIDALNRRILGISCSLSGLTHENEILYHHFYEACPCLKFAHFTANQAILEAFEGHDCVHVVDFSLMHGLQWPALIQALALRSGGPPLLRLTGIGPPSPDGRDSLREIGLRLAELARSVNIRFAFRGVAASRLEDVKPWMLQVSPKEALAVNSIMQLHKLLGSDPGRSSPMEMVLGWIRNLNPKIMTVIEQETDHNQSGYLDRFTAALYYYSTMFDSLEACTLQPEKALAEIYLQREICNIVCCEGSARVERHEPLAKWKTRLAEAGFRPLHLGSNAFRQASMLLTLFSAEGYSVEESEGCLTLGWHGRPLISASAWQAVVDDMMYHHQTRTE